MFPSRRCGPTASSGRHEPISKNRRGGFWPRRYRPRSNPNPAARRAPSVEIAMKALVPRHLPSREKAIFFFLAGAASMVAMSRRRCQRKGGLKAVDFLRIRYTRRRNPKRSRERRVCIAATPAATPVPPRSERQPALATERKSTLWPRPQTRPAILFIPRLRGVIDRPRATP